MLRRFWCNYRGCLIVFKMCEIRMISGITLVVHILTALQDPPGRADLWDLWDRAHSIRRRSRSRDCRRNLRSVHRRDHSHNGCISSGELPPCISSGRNRPVPADQGSACPIPLYAPGAKNEPPIRRKIRRYSNAVRLRRPAELRPAHMPITCHPASPAALAG